MKKALLALALVVSTIGAFISPAPAQTAAPVLPGAQKTTGCPGIVTPCFYPLPTNPTTSLHAVTVTNSSAEAVPAGSAIVYLMFYNPSAPGGNTVYCSEGGTAVVNTAGTIGIAPGQYFTQEANLISGAAWNCIAASSTPFTVGYK